MSLLQELAKAVTASDGDALNDDIRAMLQAGAQALKGELERGTADLVGVAADRRSDAAPALSPIRESIAAPRAGDNALRPPEPVVQVTLEPAAQAEDAFTLELPLWREVQIQPHPHPQAQQPAAAPTTVVQYAWF
jgi:hypothetical protein